MAGRNIDEKLRCSFCNKTQDQVKKLIAGHNGVYICDECVEICSDILDEEFETEADEKEVVDGMNINLLKPKQKIADDESLGEGFCIGHSYFCDIEEIKENTLTDIVEFEIIPLLKEYWFDEPSKVKEWTDRLRSAVK